MKICMQKTLIAICSVTLFCAATSGYANPGDWRTSTHGRINSAKAKIEQGIKHGSLTRPEAEKLNRNLDGILHKIERMKADGVLVQKERAAISHDLDKLETRVFREKHDANTAPRRRPF